MRTVTDQAVDRVPGGDVGVPGDPRRAPRVWGSASEVVSDGSALSNNSPLAGS